MYPDIQKKTDSSHKHQTNSISEFQIVQPDLQ